MGYPAVTVLQLEYLRQTGLLGRYYDWFAKRVEDYEVVFAEDGSMSYESEPILNIDFCRILREDFRYHFGERRVPLNVLKHMIDHTLKDFRKKAAKPNLEKEPEPHTVRISTERNKDYSDLTRKASAPPPLAVNQVLAQFGIRGPIVINI